MAVKVVAVDDKNTKHLIIGVSRDNVNSLLEGDVFTLLPHGIPSSLTENSDIVLLFAETDEDLEKRFPPKLRPVKGFGTLQNPCRQCGDNSRDDIKRQSTVLF